MNKMNIKNWYCFFVCFIVIGFIFACNNNAANKDASQSLVQGDSLTKSELIYNKEVFTDTVLTMKIVKSKELQCTEWKEPEKADILKLLYALQEVPGREWNDCYGDWTCGIEGELIYRDRKCYYRLDAGGWIILNDGDKQQYFVCKDDNCWKYFPSESFCDKEGNIIDSP